MTVNMKQPNAPKKLHVFWDTQEVTVLAPLQEMEPEAAIDIIVMAHPLALFACTKRLGEAVVHVHMSEANHKIYQENEIAGKPHRSPF